MVSNQDLNKHREPGCTGIIPDKKYYQVGSSFIKRTLRQHEWMTTAPNWTPSACLPQRWKTDAAILAYLQANTNIPLPRFQHAFKDDGAFYFSTELVPGVSMSQLTEDQKRLVTAELLEHVATLKSLRSDTPGVPGQTLLYALTGSTAGSGSITRAGGRGPRWSRGGATSFATTIWGSTTSLLTRIRSRSRPSSTGSMAASGPSGSSSRIGSKKGLALPLGARRMTGSGVASGSWLTVSK